MACFPWSCRDDEPLVHRSQKQARTTKESDSVIDTGECSTPSWTAGNNPQAGEADQALPVSATDDAPETEADKEAESNRREAETWDTDSQGTPSTIIPPGSNSPGRTTAEEIFWESF